MICDNIHHSNRAFTQTIKAEIHSLSLMDVHNDVEQCLSMLYSSEQNHLTDLLAYIFDQISTCNVPPFKEVIQKWHVAYAENKMKDLTALRLIKFSENSVQTLKHAKQWQEAEPPAVMALKLQLDKQ
jgi:hypothetical protein